MSYASLNYNDQNEEVISFQDDKSFLWPCEREELLGKTENKEFTVEDHIIQLTKEIDEQKKISICQNRPSDSTNMQDRVDVLINQLKECSNFLGAKSEMIDKMNILMSILTFKIYELEHEYKVKIDALKLEKEAILLSKIDENLVPLEMLNLDKIIREYESKHQGASKGYKEQKGSLQKEYEQTIEEMNEQLSLMDLYLKNLQDELDNFIKYDKKETQPFLIEYVIQSALEEYGQNKLNFQKKQLTGWKSYISEEQIIDKLNKRGLAVSLSGHILTKHGEKLTYDQAERRQLLSGLSFRSKLFDTTKSKDNEDIISVSETLESIEVSERDSLASHLSSEDVHYLKETLGAPLTLALAEITAKQPRDPIHYLGHWLFKYRYNQELDLAQKQEYDNLMAERNRMLRDKLHKLYEDEAKLFIFEMINKAENEAIKHELERILQEGGFGEEEGNNSAAEYAELKKLLNMIQSGN